MKALDKTVLSRAAWLVVNRHDLIARQPALDFGDDNSVPLSLRQ